MPPLAVEKPGERGEGRGGEGRGQHVVDQT